MRSLTLCCVLLLLSNACFADEKGSTIVRTGAISEDTYLAGERIKIDANVNGDLVLAAADINVEGKVSGDIMAVAANVSISAEIADDVRTAGGNVSLCSIVAGDAILAGGKVDICSSSIIQNKAWIAGADVTIDGRVEHDLTVRADNVRLAGIFLKNVNIEATSIEVLENTEIRGDFAYRSPSSADIHDGAKILGKEDHVSADSWWGNHSKGLSSGAAFRIGFTFLLLLVLATLLTGFILSVLLPETYDNSSRAIRSKFLQSIAIGLLVTLITPIALILLAITVIGLPLAWIGLLLYLLLLAVGGYTGLLFIADTFYRKFTVNRADSKAYKLLSILIAVVVILLIGLIPLIGTVALFLIYLLGVGALCICLIEYYEQHQPKRT